MMTMDGNGLTGKKDLMVPAVEFTFPVESDHALPASRLNSTVHYSPVVNGSAGFHLRS
jgi:hypothetical protein